MHIYIYLHAYVYACICTRKHMRMYDTVHTLKHWYQDPQSMHKYAYTYTHTCVWTHRCTNTYTHAYMYIYHVRTHTPIHIYAHTHTKCTYETHASTPGTTAQQRTCKEPLQTKEALHFSFVRRNPTTFRTSNANALILPTSCSTNTPPSPIPSSQHTPEQFEACAASQWPLA